ncbi:MAG: TIGR02186 family protein [Bacillota bacterium]
MAVYTTGVFTKARRAFWRFALLPVLLLVFTLSVGAPPALAAGVTVDVEPKQIEVGLDFAGQVVDISGTVPPGSDVLITLASPARNVNLSRKGKVGFLWMNVAKAEVEGVPKMYQIYTSGKIGDLPPALQAKTGVDPEFRTVRNACTVKEISGNRERILKGEEGKEYFDALVKMYRRDHLYVVGEGAVRTDGNRFRVSVPLPPAVAFGETLVSVYAVDAKNGEILGEGKGSFAVRAVGLAGLERAAAKTNGPLYGMLAIYIALAAGLVIDLLFNYLNKLFRHFGKAARTAQGSREAVEIH